MKEHNHSVSIFLFWGARQGLQKGWVGLTNVLILYLLIVLLLVCLPKQAICVIFATWSKTLLSGGSKIGLVSLKTDSFKCFPPSPKWPKCICSCAWNQDIRRCVWFLGVIFIMLDDIIDAVCSVKGNRNKCRGFGITTPYSTVNNSMTQGQVDLVWSSCCIADLQMRSHLIHIEHSSLMTNIELSWKGHMTKGTYDHLESELTLSL